tara:strand:+ start:1812 stop:2717 length:906 start_codon:yes stop_codon:yes gene_type:complete
MAEYNLSDDIKVLVATPNYMNQFHATVHANHIECATSWTKWGIDFNWTIVGRSFVHFARTQMCQVAVEGGFTHILWLDDDAVIDPEFLPRFIKHDKEVVIAPYCMRKMPHEIGVLSSTVGDFHNHDSYENMTLGDMGQGVIEVDGGGTHCMLVKVSTLVHKGEGTDEVTVPQELHDAFAKLSPEDALLAKQFLGEPPKGNRTFQEEDKDGLPYFVMPKTGTEDMYWCYRAKRKGIKIWCDTDVFADHMGFTPVVTKGWREHAENQLALLPASEKPYLTIIPGDTDKRSHNSMSREADVSLV